ncbi:hypothetical protein [Stenotrophomonas sp. S41]|uniref:hypothetical protein n=1 Tax=Stenotrophomonas sp. S41 TaxID=2767464 RepID=UPI001909A4BA|nr:hypothetical protein [Stenotrophomonas sp. S41]MBK0012086.1 hypothetical protein [Stenotrophomonas sp. S41]
MPNTITEWILSALAAGGGLSLIVYQIFKKLAEGWLDEKFKSRLQDLAHAQNKEIERLRNELTKSFDRATKLHQREFEVLPMVWDEVHEAFWTTETFVSPLQLHPDLNRMQHEQLQAFLEKCELDEWQKDAIRLTSDKTTQFRTYDFWHQLHHAKRARHSALNKISRHAIFLDQTMKDDLLAILGRIHGALIEHETNHESPMIPRSERIDDDITWVRKQGRQEMDNIEARIRRRLWSTEAELEPSA